MVQGFLSNENRHWPDSRVHVPRAYSFFVMHASAHSP